MIYPIEKWIKGKLFDCQGCGQCLLTHTRWICPMNCPKGLRNGPCGGTLDGRCEVLPDQDCVWTRIQQRKGPTGPRVFAPPRRELFETASYVNFLTGADRQTRRPQPVVDTLHLPASSELSRRMQRKQFVVTLEIVSPRTREGLPRVAEIMRRSAAFVDAVNTTTGAGGVPSLHSTETAKVVLEHGVEPIIQFCGRDHEPADLLAEIEAAVGMGYRNFLLLTGDWLPDVPRAIDRRTWFPMDSLQMIHAVNGQLAAFAQRLGVVPYVGCAANPFATPMAVGVHRLYQKRHAGARFCQTQAITSVPVFAAWYREVRAGREHEPRLTIPSIPLVGSRRAFEVLCRLPGVHVDEALHRLMEYDDFPNRALDWAFATAEGVTEHGAAGVHVMNFGMAPERIGEFLHQIRDRAAGARGRSSYAWTPATAPPPSTDESCAS